MSKLRILSFQFGLSRKLGVKPVRWMTMKDRQFSNLMLSFKPNRKEMQRVFDKIDADKDDRISLQELHLLLEALGKENPAAEAKQMIQAADLNRDGFIDFLEFMEVHRRGVKTGDIRLAFRVFDQNDDGQISPEELQAVLEKLGESSSLEDCRRMVNQVDKNGDGLVDMDEFMALMTNTMKLI